MGTGVAAPPLPPPQRGSSPGGKTIQPKEETKSSQDASTATADDLATICAEVLRQTLSIKGREPFGFAFLTIYAILQDFETLLTNCLSHRHDQRLAIMQRAVHSALHSFADKRKIIQQRNQWLQEIRRILDAPLPTAENPGPGSASVAQQLNDYLDGLATSEDLSEPSQAFLQHIQGVTERYTPGLFHCYDIEGLPRTNNDLESDFRSLKRRERRVTGFAQTRQRLMRHGAWLPLQVCILAESELRGRLAAVPPKAYWEERGRLDRRLKQRRRRYQLRHGRDKLFSQIEQQWRSLSPE
ncbi:MAG TPA: hypothetical protein EYP49_03140 [Anaerolineae bacterium]|nr:hypothetical protein [Anaerolineae bacterium]